MIKKVFLCFCLIFVFSVNVCASENDIYTEQLHTSGADELEENLPEDIKDYLKKNSVNLYETDWVNGINCKTVF